ncbi:MAG: hypothetical protein DMF97_15925 [Acidobacteria bacterium]|nr:MAG: hypothetical protein DMF97_15925 [Acidobacteriota bacterium]
MYQQYRDAANFYVVYIEEAHPTDLWQMSSNVKDGVLFESPRTNEERIDVATTCIVRLAVKIPALLDGIDNRIERAYTGWPDRMYIIGTDGRIHYKSAPGPFGFSTKELEASLKKLLLSSRVTARSASQTHGAAADPAEAGHYQYFGTNFARGFGSVRLQADHP